MNFNDYLKLIWEFLLQYGQIVVVIATIIGSIFVSNAIQKWIYPKLIKRSARKGNTNFRIFLRSLEGVTVVFTMMVALFILSLFGRLDSYIRDIVDLGIQVLLVISVIWFFSKLTQGLLEFYMRKGKLPKTTIFSSIKSITVFVIGLILLLGVFDISITPIVAALGIGGLAVALSLQSTLANLFAGIAIIASKQINIGDYVRLTTGEEGTIEDIQWRTTSIRSIQNNITIVPNAQLSNIIITNFSLPVTELSLNIIVNAHYDADLDFIEEVTVDEAKKLLVDVEGGVKDFEPFIRYRNFGNSSIEFIVVLRISEFIQQGIIRHEFIKRLHKRYKQESIIIPYPITSVELYTKDSGIYGENDTQIR